MNSHIVRSLLTSGGGVIFSTLLLDIIVALLVVVITWKVLLPVTRNYRLAKHLDGILGTDSKHWFFGHLQKYGFSPQGLKNICERTKTFSHVVNSWLGPFLPDVTCHHPDSTKAVLASGAPKSETAYRIMRPWIGDGLLTSSGRKWKRNRRLLTPAFHYNILKPYLKVFNASAKVMINKWESRVGEVTEIEEMTSLMTLDTMLRCAMSFQSDCQNAKEENSYINAIKEISRIVLKRIEIPILLFDWLFYITPDGRTFRRSVDTVHKLAEKIIASRQKALKENNSFQQFDEDGKRKPLDFLDILLETTDEDGKGLSDGEIRDEVDTFLFEGHDTTASGLSWIFYNLAKYPEFQGKCREEIVTLLGDKDNIEWDDLSHLRYVTMFIKESMRVCAPVPGIGRHHTEPLQLPTGNSVATIPAGCNSTVVIYAQHHNVHVWEEPERFDPERFTLENISKQSPHAYIPFSAGPRNCIGQNFAMSEIKVVMSQVLRRFRLYVDEETPVPIPIPRLVLKSESGIHIKFEPAKTISKLNQR